MSFWWSVQVCTSRTSGGKPSSFTTARKIHVDPDAAILRKTHSIVSEQVQCPVDRFLTAMAAIPVDNVSSGPLQREWCKKVTGWKQRFASNNEPHRLGPPDGRVNLYELVDALSDILTGGEVILTDAGQPTYVVPQALRLKAGQRFLAPGSLAEMGWALPAALGAAAAEPDRVIVSIIGDGSLQTNIHELQTLRHNGFNVKLVVINNGGYASIRGTQQRFFDGHHIGSTPDSGVSMPDLAKLAAAYGLPYIGCRCRATLRESLAGAFALQGPVVLEVYCQFDQEIIPIVASRRLPDGRMASAALHQMSPQLPDEELATSSPLLPVLAHRGNNGSLCNLDHRR